MGFLEPVGWEVRRAAMGYDEFTSSSYAAEMQRRLDYYNGNQVVQDPTALSWDGSTTPDVWNASLSGPGWSDLRAALPEATAEIIIHPCNVPLVRVVIDSRNVVYAVPADDRSFDMDGTLLKEETELLKRIYRAAAHDAEADQLCKWTGLFGTAFQFVGWEKNRIVRRNLTPQQVFVVPAASDPSDLQHPDCFVAIAQVDQGITSRSDGATIWQCWWNDMYWYERAPGREFKEPALLTPGVNKNPYSDKGTPVKPILVMHEDRCREIYYTGNDHLVFMNQRVDRELTALSYAMEYQGFSLLVIGGMTPEEVEAQPVSPGAAFIAQDVDTTVEFKHPALQVSEFTRAITNKMRIFARLEGIDPELVDSESSVQSGVAKAQQRISLLERREEAFPKWIPYEREVYYITHVIWNTHESRRPLPYVSRFEGVDPDDVNLNVVFGSMEIAVDPLADVLEKRNRIELDLNTREEIISSERRIPIEDSIRLADEIIKTNNKYRELKMEAVAPSAVPERIGQSGNRPSNMNRPPSRSGGSVSSSAGNNSIEFTDE